MWGDLVCVNNCSGVRVGERSSVVLSKQGLSTAPRAGDVEAAWLCAPHSVLSSPGDCPRLRYVALNS